MTLSEVPLGHIIKSGDTILVRHIHQYFLRLTGEFAGLMVMTGQIGDWEYVGTLDDFIYQSKVLAHQKVGRETQ